MGTLVSELRRRVMLRFEKPDGRTELAVLEAINEAHHTIASVRDFDELMTLDTTHAFTAEDTKMYHIEDDLALVRPKDIYSIRYMDDVNSRKLTFVPFRQLDERVPYTEQFASGKPNWYTRRGMYVELFRIPNEVKPLYIQHSQWPATLGETDETPYDNIDQVIVNLATDITHAIVEGVTGDWNARAIQLLGAALHEEEVRPDSVLVAQPFRAEEPKPSSGEPWNDPFVKRYP